MNTEYTTSLNEIKKNFKLKEETLQSRISMIEKFVRTVIETSKDHHDKVKFLEHRYKQMIIVIEQLDKDNKILSFKLDELLELLDKKERELSEYKSLIDSTNSTIFRKKNEILYKKYSFKERS